ncbi:MAG: acyl-CoA thioesterase [Phycisphaerae bacterium]|nr:acyl-CoA thioesterase [Phycisphaerae bacterium]
MSQAVFEYRVRFSDTDWMGLLHHQHYPRLFEWAREELFRGIGHSFASHIQHDEWLAVLEVSYRIRGQARYDAILRIVPRMVKVTRARIWIAYEVLDTGTGRVIATGQSLHTILDSQGKVVRVPKDVMDTARSYVVSEGDNDVEAR